MANKMPFLSVTKDKKDEPTPGDVEMPQARIVAAVNEAMRMAEEATNSEVSKLTGGMGLGF